MPLSLHIDGAKWRSHLSAMLKAKPGLVPVIKGNGYGFGLEFLAAEATRLGVETIAVGIASEVAEARRVFDGEIVLLSPDHAIDNFSDSNVIQTISTMDALQKIDVNSKVILEILTPLNRHGVDISELQRALSIIENRGLQLRGFALHLPIAQVKSSWITSTLQVLPEASTVWISHLHSGEIIRKEFPKLHFRERVGTSLWLGADSALEVTATVLENRQLKGTAGYQQVKAQGNVIVASGGTAHGIGLAAPQGTHSTLGRIKIIARAIELASGKMRSPYRWNGKTLEFLEPPHMQCSLLTYSGSDQPKPGDELKVRVRYTTTTFDQIILR